MCDSNVNTEVPKKQTRVQSGMPPSPGNPASHIAALAVEYGGRFAKEDIPQDAARDDFNRAALAVEGIEAIAKILHANEVERQSQGENADCLDKRTMSGLLAALLHLAGSANFALQDAVDASVEIFREAGHA